MTPSLPLQDLPEPAKELLASYGAEPSDLYRVLANNPALLETWIVMAWGLRSAATTDRGLREVMILRSAQRHEATYQWADHSVMASNAGVSASKIEAIAAWETSDEFSAIERVALALMDEMIAGSVTDATLAAIGREFDEGETLELILTAAFYCMVPRVLDALRLEG